MSKTLYTAGFLGTDQLWRMVQAAIDQGAREVHIGYSCCGMCGMEIDKVIDTQLIRLQANAKTVVNVHLCSDCHKEWERHTKERV